MHLEQGLRAQLEVIRRAATAQNRLGGGGVVDTVLEQPLAMCTATTSPNTSQLGTNALSAR